MRHASCAKPNGGVSTGLRAMPADPAQAQPTIPQPRRQPALRTPEPRTRASAADRQTKGKQYATVVKLFHGTCDGEIQLLEVGEVVVIKLDNGSKFLVGYVQGQVPSLYSKTFSD